LYSADPRNDADAQPITDVIHPSQIDALEKGAGDGGQWGTGGMTTKLAAARIATASGITVRLGDGRQPDALQAMLRGGRGGTVFHPHPQPLGNRKSWLAHALRPSGVLTLDDGACRALTEKGASLLLVGISDLEGEFDANQAVRLVNAAGEEVARGLSSMDSAKIREQLAKATTDTSHQGGAPVVVHRDAMVLMTPTIRPSAS
ncbi:MAG: PUA domain-containing protein, partial [Cyanobacteriota bacterium]|nr:PUA domain-containing protein [Cyanobacteriota bacterium]